jgi:hypothetical protein
MLAFAEAFALWRQSQIRPLPNPTLPVTMARPHFLGIAIR